MTWPSSPGWIPPSAVSFLFQMSEAEINGQFESVCESVFSEVESQAMDALDLPGCFRTRSHSYLRAIQAGYSQDDECIPAMTPSNITSTIRSTAGRSMPLPTFRAKSVQMCLNPRPRRRGAHLYRGHNLLSRRLVTFPNCVCYIVVFAMMF